MNRWKLVLVFVFLSIFSLIPIEVKSFRIDPPIHQVITRRALSFLNEDVLDNIVDENVQVDIAAILEGSNSQDHFDNCKFQEASFTINSRYETIIRQADPNSANLEAVEFNFGRILHAAQDFYAHSNWVELGKTTILENGLERWNDLTPQSIVNGVMILHGQDEIFNQKRLQLISLEDNVIDVVTSTGDHIPGLISGTYGDEEGCPKSIAVPHGGDDDINPLDWDAGDLNKDMPRLWQGIKLFTEARKLATEQTRHEFCRLINLIEKQYPGEGRKFIFDNWVEDETAANAACPTNNLLDLIFVIDTTGSMADDIERVRQDAIRIIGEVAAGGADWRIGIVTYRDQPVAPFGDPGDYVSKVDLEFSSNQDEIINGINRIEVAGGGDIPEAVYSALFEAIAFPWRENAQKVIILMGDAPPHDPEEPDDYTKQDVLDAAFSASPTGIFPIVIVDNNETRFAFQALADGSSGRLFYAASADDVVETVVSTINAAKSARITVGIEAQISGLGVDIPLLTNPNMSAGVIRNMPRASLVTVISGPQLAEGFIWWQIRTADGDEGWIPETTYGEVALIPVSVTSPLVGITCTLTTLQGVNIRSGPGTEYEQIASRESNKILGADGQVRGSDGKIWWQITTGYWIREDLVRESGDCSNLPVSSGL